MAIAFVSNTTIGAGGGPYTASIDTGTGSNRVMFYIAHGDTSDNMNAPTIGSDTFSLVGKTLWVGSTRYCYIWYCALTVTGTQTFTMTGPSDMAQSSVTIYSGANTTSNYVTTQAVGTSFSLSASGTPATDSVLIGGAGNLSANIVGGTNTTIRSAASGFATGDSVGTASPTALAYTWGGASTAYFGNLCELSASGGGGTVLPFRALQGVGI